MQEDFLIQKVDHILLSDVVNWHVKNNNLITKLGNNQFFSTTDTSEVLFGAAVLKHCDNSNFIMSHQPIALFNTAFMVHTNPDPPVSARMHEYVATHALSSMPDIIDRIKIVQHPGVIEYTHCIADGKLIVDLDNL